MHTTPPSSRSRRKFFKYFSFSLKNFSSFSKSTLFSLSLAYVFQEYSSDTSSSLSLLVVLLLLLLTFTFTALVFLNLQPYFLASTPSSSAHLPHPLPEHQVQWNTLDWIFQRCTIQQVSIRVPVHQTAKNAKCTQGCISPRGNLWWLRRRWWGVIVLNRLAFVAAALRRSACIGFDARPARKTRLSIVTR